MLIRTVAIECTKEGVKFTSNGDIGNGSVTLRSHTDVEKPDNNVEIQLTEPVALTFSLKYLSNFCKATGLAGQVSLSLSNEVPLLVEYKLANSSYLRFYLAPKVWFRSFFLMILILITRDRLVMRSRRHDKNRFDIWIHVERIIDEWSHASNIPSSASLNVPLHE